MRQQARLAGWGLALVLALGLLAVGAPGQAQERKPLLMTGKKTLYERVITHPGAQLRATAGSEGKLVQETVKPFTAYYVYGRQSAGGAEWLEVGPSTDAALGWVEARLTTPWRQALTLVMSERTGRQPVLFFRSRQALDQVAQSNDPGATCAQLSKEFSALQGQAPKADFPLLAMEPARKAVSQQRFYLMPIMACDEPYEGVKFLEVACIDPGNQTAPGPKGNGQAAGKTPGNLDNLRTGIAFVIDTTISMGPYIERARQAVRTIYDQVQKAGLADKVAFGMVAYRNNLQKAPGLEYVAKVISDLHDGAQRADLERALAQVSEAKASSHSFDEDAFAGVKLALDQLNWQPYGGRLIYLISDAGALRNNDPLSATGLNETEVANLAHEKNVKIIALHLKTPAGVSHGRNDHATAEAQYRALTGQADKDLGPLYQAIEAGQPGGGVDTYGQVVEAVSNQMVAMVEKTAKGELLPPPSNKPESDPVKEMQRKAAALGYAMQLEFLGRRDAVRAPQVVRAQVSDMDLSAPGSKPNFMITVLLTKNQLSDLQRQLKAIVDSAMHTKQTGSKDFFQGIVSASTQMSRDPSAFSRAPGANLAQLGVLGEFLDDLPYKSSVQRITEERWYAMSVGEQTAFINDLRSKIRLYAEYHDDKDNWESFGAANPGDAVYRVPLSMLP